MEGAAAGRVAGAFARQGLGFLVQGLGRLGFRVGGFLGFRAATQISSKIRHLGNKER